MSKFTWTLDTNVEVYKVCLHHPNTPFLDHPSPFLSLAYILLSQLWTSDMFVFSDPQLSSIRNDSQERTFEVNLVWSWIWFLSQEDGRESVKHPWWMFEGEMSVDGGENWGQGGFPDVPVRWPLISKQSLPKVEDVAVLAWLIFPPRTILNL